MLTASRNRGVVHAGSLTCKSSRGMLGFMMICAACIIMLWVLMNLFREAELSEHHKKMAAGLSAVGCLFFYFGTTWFFSFITGYSRKLSITETGILYGTESFTWLEVAEVGARMKWGFFQVYIVLRRGWHTSRWLVTDDGMTLEMAEEFIKTLTKKVLPQHSHLTIGKLSLKPQSDDSDAESPS